MAEEPDRLRRHFILEGVTETEPYRYPGSGGGSSSKIPAQNRVQHGGVLQRQIDELRAVAESARDAQQAAGMEDGLGLQVEFESFPDIELAFESLAREHWGIELLNVRHEEERHEKRSTFAAVFVPDGKLDHFERLIRDYLAEKRDKAGNRRDNQRLIDAIREIRAASLRALWTDAADLFPAAADGAVWWEIWLPVRQNRHATVAAFRERAQAQGMEVAEGVLMFPERTVLMARASVGQMQRSMVTLNSIAELRRPKETAEFFDSLGREEQVTLSYFIEPNPSRRGHRSRYRYESHGLRFEVKRPLESVVEFRKRINLAARDENEGNPGKGEGDPAWLIGTQGRHRGSLHGDIWLGTAADLASRGVIAVYPTAGWWKTRQALERYDKAARYALIVSIRAPEVDVDLYTEVANQIEVDVRVGL